MLLYTGVIFPWDGKTLHMDDATNERNKQTITC